MRIRSVLLALLCLGLVSAPLLAQTPAAMAVDRVGDIDSEMYPPYLDLVAVSISRSTEGLLFTLSVDGNLDQAFASLDEDAFGADVGTFVIVLFDESGADAVEPRKTAIFLEAGGLGAIEPTWALAVIPGYEPGEIDLFGSGVFFSSLPAHVSSFRNTLLFILSDDVLESVGELDAFSWQAATFESSWFDEDLLAGFEDPTAYIDRMPDTGQGSWPQVTAVTPIEEPAASVDIPDYSLQQAILDGLGESSWEKVTLADLESLTDLDAGYYGISDLTGIEQCANLTSLTLTYNEVTDIAPLATLTKLTRLVLWGNTIADLSPLAGLTELTYLDLDETGATDISALAGMSKLQTIYLSYNSLSDTTPLGNLSSLLRLYMAWSDVEDISAVSSLTALQDLSLVGNPLSSLPDMTELESLEYLNLASTGLTDLAPLLTAPVDPEAGFTLNLSGSAVEDLSPLAAVTWLNAGDLVDVRGTPGAATAGTVLAPLVDAGVDVSYLKPLELGDLAPDFELPILGASEVQTTSLSAYIGHVVILDFWASWCGPCRDSMPALEALAQEVTGKDVVLLGVNLDQSAQNALDYMTQNPFEVMIPLGGDYAQTSAVSDIYGDLLASGIPHTFVIDEEGIVQYSGHPGYLDAAFIEDL